MSSASVAFAACCGALLAGMYPGMHYPLVIPVKVLKLPLLLLLLSGLVRLFRLTPVKLCVSVCKPLRVEAPLSFVLLCWPVVYQMK